MSEDEIRVLHYVQAGLGDPNSIRADLRPVYYSLIERGYIIEVPTYVLTDQGRTGVAPIA